MAYMLDKEKNFSQQIVDACHKPALAALALFLIYTILFVQPGMISASFLTIIITKGISISVFFIVNFLCLPYTYGLFSRTITAELTEKEQLDEGRRTRLAMKIMSLPIKLCVTMVFWMLLVAGALCTCYHFFLFMDLFRAIALLLPYFFASFFSSLMVYTREESICTAECQTLMRMGIDDALVHKYQCFGMKISVRVFYHIALPIICTALIIILYSILNYPTDGSTKSLFIFSGTVLVLVSLLQCTVVASALKNHTVKEVADVNNILETVLQGNVDSVLQLPVDLGTELSYTFYCINELIVTLQERRVHSSLVLKNLTESLDVLAMVHRDSIQKYSKESADVEAQIQLVEQIQSTFQKLQQQQKNSDVIGNKILSSIEQGRLLLMENTSHLEAISQGNIETITGIKRVSDQMDSVWQYISVIDDIAEKNRTIAFNTEIESTATGENAENFHIIAAEIRRLAASITESTREIRNRITDIQHSTDNLIITSEGGTEKIREESELFSQVEDSFEALALSGKVTDESYVKIGEYIQQEAEMHQKLLEAFSQYTSSYTRFIKEMENIGSVTAICQLLVQEETHD